MGRLDSRRSVVGLIAAIMIAGLLPTQAVASDPSPVAPMAEELAHAVDLRQSLGLPADARTVADAFARGLSADEYGIPLSASELKSAGAVVEAQRALIEVADKAAAEPGYVGAYYEGASLVIVAAEPSAFKLASVRLPDNAVVTVQASLGDPVDYQEALADVTASSAELLTHGLDMTSLYLNPRSGLVEVGVRARDEASRSWVQKRFGPLVDLVEDGVASEGGLYACGVKDCGTKGGLWAKNAPVAGCTTGFLARRNSTSARFMLTAGHCILQAGGLTGGAWLNGASTINWGDGANYEYADTGNVSNDIGAFWVTGSQPSIWNQYFRSSATILTITDEVPASAQNPGMVLCRGGITSGWDCGTVSRKAIQNFKYQQDATPTWHVINEIRLGSDHGDSGAGFILHTQYGTDQAAGILSGGETRSGVAYTYFYPTEFDIFGVHGYWSLHPCELSSCP